MFFPSMPGLGARERLSDAVLRHVVERFHEHAERQRKSDAFKRRLLWDENFVELVDDLTNRIYSDKGVIAQMKRHSSVTMNPAKDITKAVAVVYKRGVHRLLADASDEQEEDWLRLYAEGDAQLQGMSWNQFAFLLGPVLVAPVIRRGRLIRETILPYQVELELDESNRKPVAAMWAVRHGASYRRRPNTWREVSYVYVDQEKWVYLDGRGERVEGPDGLEVVEHGLRDDRGEPVCPLAVFRLDHPTHPDWWSAGQNERLLSGTVEVAWIWSRLDMLRTRQDSHFLFAKQAREGAFPTEQLVAGDPEGSIVATDAQAAASSLDAVAYNTSPENHLAHIRAKTTQLAMAYGIPADSLSFNFGGGETKALSIRLGAEQRAALRNEQVPFMRAGETDLAMLQAAAVRAAGPDHGHWYAADCPPPDEIRDRFILDVPELNRTEDPRARREEEEWQIANGLRTVIDIARDRWNLPPGQTRRRLRDNLEENARYGMASTVQLPATELDQDQDAPLPTAGVPGAPPAAGVEDVQRTALNGAQHDALKGYLLDISAGLLSSVAAEIAIAQGFPTIPADQVKRMVAAAAQHQPTTQEPDDERQQQQRQQRQPELGGGGELDPDPDPEPDDPGGEHRSG